MKLSFDLQELLILRDLLSTACEEMFEEIVIMEQHLKELDLEITPFPEQTKIDLSDLKDEFIKLNNLLSKINRIIRFRTRKEMLKNE